MDLSNSDDGSGGKKMGLARLAKTCSLSSSLNNLNSIEKSVENRDGTDSKSLHEDERTHDYSLSETSPSSRPFNKQSGGVNLLPNKMNLSALSGHQLNEKRSRVNSLDESVHSLDISGHSVPCSDPDFIKPSKGGMRSPSLVSAKSSSVDKPPAAGKEQPQTLLVHRPRLSPPQIKRSSSMTRLSEAINQIHNICVFPAQPLVVAEKNVVSVASNVPSPKSQITCSPSSEVMCSAGYVTPLLATSCRDNKTCTQTPKLTRCSESKQGKHQIVPCTESLLMPFVNFRDNNSSSRVYSSALDKSSTRVYPHSSNNLLDNSCDLIPLRTNFPRLSDANGGRINANGESLCTNVKMSKTRLLPQDDEYDTYGTTSSSDEERAMKKSISSPSDIGHVPGAGKKYLKDIEEKLLQTHEDKKAGTQGTINAVEEVSGGYGTEDSSLQNCRSASLDELTNVHVLPGLPSLSPADAKRRNYLFGGLGNGSLLGSKELDRYFPNRTLTIFIATWNMNGKEPPQTLEEFLLPEAMEQVPDMYVVGTQESGGSRSEWEVRLQATIGPSHVLFTSAIFGVLHLTIFLRRDLIWFCSVPEEDTYSLRPGIAYKTKGGMAIGFQFFGTRMLFINSHLTAHEEKQALRIQNVKNISQSLDLPRLLPNRSKSKDVTQRYDCVFWLGDLNFRLAANRDLVFERLRRPITQSFQHLMQWDQLSQARNKGEAFSEFEEGSITFAPTFKFDPGTDHYDSSSKQRVPSYTDRILFKSSRGSITCSSYDSCPLFRTSDHKPVSGIFQCKIRPGKDDVPLAAGLFNREVYLEAIRRRKKFMYQPALRNCPVQ